MEVKESIKEQFEDGLSFLKFLGVDLNIITNELSVKSF